MQYAERFIEEENMINGNAPVEPAMEAVAVSVHKRKKHVGKRKEDLKGLSHGEPIFILLQRRSFWKNLVQVTVS